MKIIKLFAVLSFALSAAACTAETSPSDEPPTNVEATKSGDESEPPPPVEEKGVEPMAAHNPLFQAGSAGVNPLY